jgi:hypothetical protein
VPFALWFGFSNDIGGEVFSVSILVTLFVVLVVCFMVLRLTVRTFVVFDNFVDLRYLREGDRESVAIGGQASSDSRSVNEDEDDVLDMEKKYNLKMCLVHEECELTGIGIFYCIDRIWLILLI